MNVYPGDIAVYDGPLKGLKGLRCNVDSYTPTQKRVRCDVRLADGAIVRRLIKPENLKRLGGGVLGD